MKIVFNPLTGEFETLYQVQSGIGLLTNLPCDPSVYLGSAVYINQSGTIFPALADSESTSNVLGIVESINGSICNVRLFGISKDLFTGLDVTKQYYLSATTPGALATEPPTNNSYKVVVGIPVDDKKLLVFKSERQLIQFEFIESGIIDFGTELNSDLEIDTGDRTNDTSIVDQGLRVIEGG